MMTMKEILNKDVKELYKEYVGPNMKKGAAVGVISASLLMNGCASTIKLNEWTPGTKPKGEAQENAYKKACDEQAIREVASKYTNISPEDINALETNGCDYKNHSRKDFTVVYEKLTPEQLANLKKGLSDNGFEVKDVRYLTTAGKVAVVIAGAAALYFGLAAAGVFGSGAAGAGGSGGFATAGGGY